MALTIEPLEMRMQILYEDRS